MSLMTCYIEDYDDGSFKIFKANSPHPFFINKNTRPHITYACKDTSTAIELTHVLVDRLSYMSKRKHHVYVEVAAVISDGTSNHGWTGSHELSYVDRYQNREEMDDDCPYQDGDDHNEDEDESDE